MDIDYSLLWYIPLVLLTMAGVLGCVLPYPGHLFILGTCVLHACVTPESAPAWWVWLLLVVLMVFGMVVDTLTTMMGARKYGSSKAAMWGTIPGVVIGAFFFPLGLIIGPFLGAFAAEIIFEKKDVKDSATSGWGATLGYAFGVLAKLIVAIVMLVVYALL